MVAVILIPVRKLEAVITELCDCLFSKCSSQMKWRLAPI